MMRVRDLRLCLSIIASLPLFRAEGALTPDETLGVRIASGFRITQYSDHELANDIYAMTLDSRGRVVVTSQGWIKTLHDMDGDGKADQATVYAETRTGGDGNVF